MLCVSGAERFLDGLAARLARHADAGLQEIRLDYLQAALPRLSALPVDSRKVIVACRPAREGGAFHGGEPERLRVLESVIRQRTPFSPKTSRLIVSIVKPPALPLRTA